MNILLTALSLVCLIGCFLAYTRAQKEADTAEAWRNNIETNALKLRTELPRLTAAEREIETLRRELRKLSGKFYASQREEIEIADTYASDPIATHNLVPCDNYAIAQREGPNSKAAKCECDYCTRRRKEKAEFKQRQAEKGHLDPRWIAAHTSGTGNHGE